VGSRVPNSRFKRPAALSVLGQRGYRNFWIAGTFADIGLNIWFLGAVWLVLELTDSVAWVGLVGGMSAAPVLLTLVGGALGDRWNRRNIVIGSRVAWFAMGLVIALLVMSDAIEPWHILLGALTVGLVDSIGSPASGALIVDLVGKPRLLAATSMNELANYTGEIIAPLLVGVLIAGLGINSTFYAAAIALGIGVVFILRVPLPRKAEARSTEEPEKHQNLFADIRDGFRHTRRTPGIAPLLLLASRMLFGAALFPMIPTLRARRPGRGKHRVRRHDGGSRSRIHRRIADRRIGIGRATWSGDFWTDRGVGRWNGDLQPIRLVRSDGHPHLPNGRCGSAHRQPDHCVSPAVDRGPNA